jgi:hypothetical protein
MVARGHALEGTGDEMSLRMRLSTGGGSRRTLLAPLIAVTFAVSAMTFAAPTFAAPALRIRPLVLASATVGVPYHRALRTEGGTSPYTYAVVAGALPTGIVLSPAGVLSGSPEAAGKSHFIVEVTDSSSPALSAKRLYTLKVANAASLAYYRYCTAEHGCYEYPHEQMVLDSATKRWGFEYENEGIPDNPYTVEGNEYVFRQTHEPGSDCTYPTEKTSIGFNEPGDFIFTECEDGEREEFWFEYAG